MRHVLTLGRTPNGFSVSIGLQSVPSSEAPPRDTEEHDAETCEICAMMRAIEHTRGIRRRSDNGGTD